MCVIQPNILRKSQLNFALHRSPSSKPTELMTFTPSLTSLGNPSSPTFRKLSLKPPMGLLEYQDLTLEGLECEAAYSDY